MSINKSVYTPRPKTTFNISYLVVDKDYNIIDNYKSVNTIIIDFPSNTIMDGPPITKALREQKHIKLNEYVLHTTYTEPSLHILIKNNYTHKPLMVLHTDDVIPTTIFP